MQHFYWQRLQAHKCVYVGGRWHFAYAEWNQNTDCTYINLAQCNILGQPCPMSHVIISLCFLLKIVLFLGHQTIQTLFPCRSDLSRIIWFKYSDKHVSWAVTFFQIRQDWVHEVGWIKIAIYLTIWLWIITVMSNVHLKLITSHEGQKIYSI